MDKKIKKIVISYSYDDRDVAKRLRQTLMDAGYDVWIDSEGLKGSVKWTQTILDVIDSVDGLVLLWSSNAKKSDNVFEEIRIARVFIKSIFPVLAHPNENAPSLPEEIKSLQIITGFDFDSIAADLIARLSDPKRNNIEYTTLVKNGYLPKPPNRYFVGRNKELKELFVDTFGFHGESKKGVPIAISGLAGIGKTQLALTFGYRFNLLFSDGVYWLDTPNGIVQEFEKIGSHLKIKRLKEERPLEYATRVYNRLCRLDKGLVIFDNIIDLKEFRKWCPVGSGSCSVILTTRKSPRGFAVRVMNLTEIDADSAYQLIISRRKSHDKISIDKTQQKALREICEIMGNHPLGLELCACYLQSVIVKPTEFLSELKKDVFASVAIGDQFENFIGDGNTNLLDVLRLNYESLNRKIVDPYFFLMCWFATHSINIDLIINAYDDKNEGRAALKELNENSLIYIESNDFFSLHPLVVQYGRSLQKTMDTDYRKKIADIVIEYLKRYKNDLTNTQVRRELPHIFEAIKIAQKDKLWDSATQLHLYCADVVAGMDTRIEQLNAAYKIIEKHLHSEKRSLPNICVQLGKAYKAKAQYKTALTEFNKANNFYTILKKVDPGDIVSLQFELGDVNIELGEYNEAQVILAHALDKALKLFDKITPEVTQIQQSLSRIDLLQGNYEEAENKIKYILAHRERFYKNHPDAESSEQVSSSYADLSQLALESGNYDEAIEAYEKALEFIEEYYDENDLAYGNLYLLLGSIHFQAGKYSMAEEQIKNAINNFFPIYGERHPKYAKTLVIFSDVHRKLGKFNEAQSEIEQAIDVFEERYGGSHPFVAEALDVMGKIYDHMCEFDEEEKIWNRILEIYSTFYTDNHPALATTHYNYGNLCLRMGQFDKAQEHLKVSLRITKQNFGETHLHYFGRLIRLAACYYEQQEYSEAKKRLEQAERLRNNIFGESSHPFIARMYQLQSEINRRLGKFKDALENIDQAITMKKKIYHKDHPSVAEALEVQVKVFHHQGKTTQAEKLIKQALKIREYHYGETHPEVGRSEHDFGSYHLRLGNYKKAISRFERAREITELTFGKSHPEFIERTIALANARFEQGEYGKAQKLLENIKDVLDSVITSENHYLKARWLFGMGELHRRLGKFKDALDYVGQAIDMRVAIYGKVHPAVAEVLECQGKIYGHLCEFDKEEQIWRRIIDSKVYPKNHPALAIIYYNYGNLCLQKGEFDEALNRLEMSRSITEKSFGKKHLHYFGRLILVAVCYYKQQKYSLAAEELKEAQGLQNDIFGQSFHPFIARMHQLQSEIDRRLGNFDQALESINQAMTMKEEIYGKDHPSVAEALEVKVKVFHHLGESGKVKQLIDRALKIRKKCYGVTHREVGRSEHDLGAYYLRLGQYDRAIFHFTKALEITESIFGKCHLEYIERALELANARDEQGEYHLALKLVEELDDVIDETISSKNHYLKARWLQEMGELERRLGEFDKALGHINQAIAMKEAIYDKVHPSVAEALGIKGKIYDHLCEFDEEERIWDRILDIQSEVYPENHPALATTHYDYGNLCLRKGNFDKALEHLKKSYSITEMSFGEKHSHYFGRLIRLATCHYEQQNYSQAQKNLEQAQELQNSIFGKLPHPFIARMHQLQSEVDQRLGKFDVALKSINQAIAMKEDIYGKDHLSVAEALEVKVDLNLAQFRGKESKGLLEIIERIRKEAYDEKHPEYSNYQMRLAEYYSIGGRYEQAQKVIEKSLQICIDKFTSGHPEIIKRQVMSARLARISGNIIDAEKRIDEALRALGNRLKTEKSLIVASVLKELANIKRKQSDYKNSLVELERTIEIESKILGAESPGVVELLVNKVKLLIVFHHLVDANTVIENAIKNTIAEEPIYKRLRADLLDQRGILETSRHEFDKAIKSFDEAIKIKREMFGDNHVELAKLFVDKAVTLKVDKKYNKAFANLQEAQNINNLHFRENHVFFARICLENGRTYLRKKSYLAAKEQLEDALKIYQVQPKQDLREHANAAEALGLVYLETGFLSDALQQFGDALEIKMSIYDGQHPAITETVYNVLKIAAHSNVGKEKIQNSARQKIEKSLRILQENEGNSSGLTKAIGNALSSL